MKRVLGVDLRRDPARDERFTVVQLPRELCEYPPGTDAWRRESLHRHYNTEVQSLEIAAQSLADFPDAPWELRMQHARQCWDEARHAQLIERQLREQGGRAGEFPIINYDYGVACAVGTLTGRLAVQNRTVEAGEMDLLQQLRDVWRESNELETAAVMDGILADEVQHVRFANDWVKQETRRNPRTVMTVAAAMNYVRAVTDAFTPASDEENRSGIKMSDLDRAFALNVEDRRLAGFVDEDIAALQTSWWRNVDFWVDRANVGGQALSPVAYRFADLTLAVDSTYRQLLDDLESAYGDCAATGAADLRCTARAIDRSLLVLEFSAPFDLADIAYSLLRPRVELQHFVPRELGRGWTLIANENDESMPLLAANDRVAIVDTRLEPFEFLLNFVIAVAQLAQSSMMFVHAGAVSINGRGTLLIGASGRGKSTTTAALASRGHALLGDETVGLRPDTTELFSFRRTLRLRPGPKPRVVADRLTTVPYGTRLDAFGNECVWIKPTELFPGAQPPQSMPLNDVFFLRSFAEKASIEPFVPTLEHVDELRGLPMSLSHVASWPSTDAHRLMRFVRLLEVFKHCRCYFVDLGTPDETAALIERTVQDNAQCA